VRARADFVNRQQFELVPGMFSLRTLALVAFFVALAALEIAHGMFRMDTLHEQQARVLLDRMERRHAELADDLRRRIDSERDHAAYLARVPSVRELPANADANAQHRAEADVLAYVASFREIDRVAVLDTNGVEVLRCERIGGGVGALPRALLASEPNAAALELARRAEAGRVAMSRLDVDERRVEVDLSQRQVLHFATCIPRADGPCSGALVLTVYAAPMLAAVRNFEPAPGIQALWMDENARDVAPLLGENGELPRVDLSRRSAASLARVMRGEAIVIDGDTHMFAAPISSDPPTHLLTLVTDTALEQSLGSLRGEYAWIIASMVATTAVLALAAAFFQRLGVRAFRQRETEGYLAQIRRESQRYRALMEGAADMILIVEPRFGFVRERNASARAALGDGELDAILPQGDLARLRAALISAAATTGAAIEVEQLRLRARDGRDLIADARLAGIDLGDERVVEVSLRDLTRQRAMEQRLQTSERLSSIGLLTAGVAHEINNPLEGIGNYLNLLDKPELTDEKRRRYVELVRHGFERIGGIVRDLLAFARPGVEHGTADLARVVAHAITMVKFSEAMHGVAIEQHGLDAALPVPGDEGRLEQVVVNLLLNAATAMKGAGRVLISVERVGERPGAATAVELAIEDEGPGIAREDLPRIFDPFFTTTQGTGLGLAVSYGIVRAHGGRLSASNRASGGARFVVHLPLTTPVQAGAD
jgi:signal transduction histidine kinase